MSDFIMVGGAITVVAIAAVAAGLYLVYGGSKATLDNAKPGQIFNFLYEQPLEGDPERFLAKVISVNVLNDDTISRLNKRSRYRKNDPTFQRTRHLVTCQTPDGKVRNFYAERTTNCRKPLFASTVFKSGIAAMFL